MHPFNDRSLRLVETLHPDLKVVLLAARAVAPFPFDIPDDGGHRTTERQRELYMIGREIQRGVIVRTGRIVTNIDGVTKKSKHNESPSQAVDLYCNIKNKADLAFNQNQLLILAGVIIAVSNQLLLDGKISHDVRCGCDWDMDGEAIRDQKLQDLAHYELKWVGAD